MNEQGYIGAMVNLMPRNTALYHRREEDGGGWALLWWNGDEQHIDCDTPIAALEAALTVLGIPLPEPPKEVA